MAVSRAFIPRRKHAPNNKDTADNRGLVLWDNKEMESMSQDEE